MAITDWPVNERPREKLLIHGAAILSDAELLAIFLRTGVRGKTAVDVARDLLQEFNGLRPLLDADQEMICRHQGLGPIRYVQLQAALEIGRRNLQATLKRSDVMTHANETGQFLMAKMRNYQQEVFACLFLDSHHRVIIFEELFHGTIDGTAVHPRIVIKRALFHNAAAVIFAHNHPSGVAEPSEYDKQLTSQLKTVLALVDIKVLDHFIIGDSQIVSLLQLGFM
jgi:DNA repair protein RadC